MVTICPGCSNVDYDKLVELVGRENVECTCIGYCGGIDGDSIGFIDGEFVQVSTEEEFFEMCK
ncbi:MAG: DUF1450 domain-containing protein [Clostridium sp.]